MDLPDFWRQQQRRPDPGHCVRRGRILSGGSVGQDLEIGTNRPSLTTTYHARDARQWTIHALLLRRSRFSLHRGMLWPVGCQWLDALRRTVVSNWRPTYGDGYKRNSERAFLSCPRGMICNAMQHWQHRSGYEFEILVVSLYWTDSSVGRTAMA